MRSHVVFAALLAVLALLPLACLESSSGSNVVRETGITVAGTYSTSDGSPLVTNNSGEEITALTIRQSGSQLTGIDNNGNVYNGALGNVSGESANFNLESNISGRRSIIDGLIAVSGSEATISGRWVESDRLGSVSGSSAVSDNDDDDDDDDGGDGDDGDDDEGDEGDDGDDNILPLTITPAGNQELEVGQTRSFAADGGIGDYGWRFSDGSLGTLSQTSGANSTYTATAAGTQILTLRSGTGMQSVTINQTDPSMTSVPNAPLTIEPPGTNGTLQVQTGGIQELTASGGTGTYIWDRSNPSLGALNTQSGSVVIYTAGASEGIQVISVISGDEDSQITIAQIEDLVEMPETPTKSRKK